jgi:CO/xanthine dehydrogenase Mo-binding subunit
MAASDFTFWLGKDKSDLKAIGKRGVIRRDADDKATGKAKYGRDFKLPGMLYARVLVSPYAHAKIKSMDTSAAEKLPGVRVVLRYDDPDVPSRLYAPWDADFIPLLQFPAVSMPFYVLGDEALFAGAPVGVAIAADELDIVDEALELVKVEWEELPFVIDVEAAAKSDAPLAYEFIKNWNPQVIYPSVYADGITVAPYGGTPSNIKDVINFTYPTADMDKGFAAADKTIEFSFKRTEVNGWGPEILSTTALWTDNNILEAWQAGEQVQPARVYASILGIPETNVVIHSPYAGAQFGGWDLGVGPQSSQIPVAALLSKKAGFPVKLLNRRQDEHFGEMDEGTYNCKVGYKQDGTITAVKVDSLLGQCNFIGGQLGASDQSGTGHLLEGTRITNLQSVGTCVFLNKHAFGPSRCEQQSDAHVMSQVYSRVAAALGVDEGTIALKNDGCHGHDMAYVSNFKKQNKIPDIDSASIVIKTGKDAIGWDQKFHAPGAKKLANGHLHGMIMAAQHEFQNGGLPYDFLAGAFPCYVTVDGGKVFIIAERPDCGLDGRTNYSRVLAEVTGMKLEDVEYPHSWEEKRTEPHTLFNGGGGSVVFTWQTWVVTIAGRLLKQKMLAAAAAVFNCKADELDIVDSAIVYKNDKSKATPVEELSFLTGLVATSSEADRKALGIPDPPTDNFFTSRCVDIVEVEVDPETGGVEITNAVCVNDVGVAASPETVEGQMYGAAIMGYSTSAIEEVVYDAGTGVILNPNFIDYKIFTILDLPDVECHMVENRMGYAPFGMAGVGEDNCTFCSSMMIPAIYNATGVWIDTYPPTPDRVLKALGKG